jgi:hypothetical protein
MCRRRELPLPLAVLTAAARESGEALEDRVVHGSTALSGEKNSRVLQHLSLFGSDVVKRVYEPFMSLRRVPELKECDACNS